MIIAVNLFYALLLRPTSYFGCYIYNVSVIASSGLLQIFIFIFSTLFEFQTEPFTQGHEYKLFSFNFPHVGGIFLYGLTHTGLRHFCVNCRFFYWNGVSDFSGTELITSRETKALIGSLAITSSIPAASNAE